MQSCTRTFPFLWLTLSCLFLAGLFASCENHDHTSPQNKGNASQAVAVAQHPLDVPALLPRNPQIGSADEQAKVSNTYQDLKQMLALDPQDYRRRLQLAQLFMLEARATGEHGHYYPAALKVLDDILAENPPEDVVFGATSLKASVYLSLHKFDQAKDLAQYAVSLNGYNAVIYGSLVDAHVELGNYQAALEMADKMVSIRPDLRSYSRVSYLREIHGQMEGAVEAMRRAVEAGYPGYEETAWCRLTLGNLYEGMGDLAAAEKQYRMILMERPGYPFAQAALANLHQKQGEYQRAESELKTAIEAIPEVGFYEQLAGLYQETGREVKAEAMTQEILVMLADDEAKGHKMGLEYAEVYLSLIKDYDQALNYAQQEYEKRPQNIDVNRMMAEVLYQKGRHAEALKHVETALRTGSQNARLLCVAGLVKKANGQVAAGQSLLAQAWEIDPYQSHALAAEAQSML